MCVKRNLTFMVTQNEMFLVFYCFVMGIKRRSKFFYEILNHSVMVFNIPIWHSTHIAREKHPCSSSHVLPPTIHPASQTICLPIRRREKDNGSQSHETIFHFVICVKRPYSHTYFNHTWSSGGWIRVICRFACSTNGFGENAQTKRRLATIYTDFVGIIFVVCISLKQKVQYAS